MASESESGSEFEVGQILQQRKRRGLLEYLVRWKGFGPEEDSWENVKNLSHAQHLVDEFTKPSTKPSTKKSIRRASSSRSRSRSSSRSRSRGRSSSKGRNTGVKSSTPAKKGTKTEVVRKTQTAKIPGGFERTTEVIRKTTTRPELEVKSRTPLKSLGDATTKTVFEHKSETVRTTVRPRFEPRPELHAEPKKSIPQSRWPDYLSLTSSDFPAIIVFSAAAIIALSFVLEEYVDFQAVWEWLVALVILVVAWFKGLFGA